MNKQSKFSAVCTLIPVGIVVGVFMSSKDANAKLSEIDGFDQAVTAGSVEDVLGFIDAFPSSHLVIDLIELVPPDVATRVCASLPDGAGSLARRACNSVQEAIDSAPAAGGATSGSPAAEVTPAPTRTAALIGSRVNDDSNSSGDKQKFLATGPTNDASTGALSARRDGMPADDTTKGTTSATADDTTDTADTDDTAESSETGNTSTRTGNPNHGGPSVDTSTGTGNPNHGGPTGGSNDGGAENGGGNH